MNRKDCAVRADAALREKIAKNKVFEAERLEKLYAELPELRKIENELRENMAEFTDFAFSGDTSDEKFFRYKEKSLSLQKKRKEILIAANYAENAWETRFYCEKCRDNGYTEKGTCECYKRELSEQILMASNLSAVFREKSFVKFDLSYYKNPTEREKMALTLDYAKRYVKNFKKGGQNLLFMGRSGSGKTFLSCAVGLALIEQGVFVFYASAQDMITEFEAEKFGKQSRTGDTAAYFDADLLIIDDLGSEFQTPFSDSVLYNVVNSRLNAKKPMIISTNYVPSDLKGSYHDRLVSRLLNEFLTPVFADVDVRELIKLNKR